MKTLYYLLIGVMFTAFGCSEELLPAEDFATLKVAKKNAEVVKTVTIPAYGQVTTVPDYSKPMLPCTPAGMGVNVVSEGTATGHSTMTGAFVQEETSFKTYLCEVQFTSEGTPVIYAETDVVATGNSGDHKFVKSYLWIDAVTGLVTGYNELTGGTGRFEGISGRVDIVEGKLDPGTGVVSWKEKGYMEVVVRD